MYAALFTRWDPGYSTLLHVNSFRLRHVFALLLGFHHFSKSSEMNEKSLDPCLFKLTFSTGKGQLKPWSGNRCWCKPQSASGLHAWPQCFVCRCEVCSASGLMALVMGVGQGQEVTISGNSEASIKQPNHSGPAGLLWGSGSEVLLISCSFWFPGWGPTSAFVL